MRWFTLVRWTPLVLVAILLSTLPAAPHIFAAIPQDVVGNIVPDGGFEQQGQGWQTCGGITFADTQANAPATLLRVHSGRYAAQFSNPTIEQGTEACPEGGFESPHQLIRVPVQIPASADVLTVSFWYSRIGPENTGDVAVFLSDQPDFIIDFPGLRLDNISEGENIGWHEFRQIMRGDELAKARKTRADFTANRPPSGTTYLNIRLERSLAADEVLGLFIDDVAVTFTDRSLQPSPLPAALRGDGTQPIAYMHVDPGEDHLTVHRMDTDGQRSQKIYRTRLLGVRKPRWSPNGQRLIVIEEDLKREDQDTPNVNPAIVDELTIVNANGTPLAAPGRALGKSGIVGSPPGCNPVSGQFCARREEEAIDSAIYNADWSPDSNALVIELGFHSRDSLGATGDDSTSLMLVNSQTPFDIVGDDQSRIIADGGTEPSWGPQNTILYRNIFDGIYTDTPEIKQGNEQNVVPNLGGIIGRRQDAQPAWSRDGTRFVTIRRVAGGETFYGNKAIVLHDPTSNERTRALVTVDRPSNIVGKPTWSPDSKYILYTLQTPTQNADGSSGLISNIWWLEVASGNTGPLTTDGVSSDPDWRPTSSGGVPAGQQPGGGTGVQVGPGFQGVRKVFVPFARRG